MTELTGIARNACPSACNVDRCVISGKPYCAHPHQSGLQFALKNEESLARYDAACKALGIRNINTTAERLTP